MKFAKTIALCCFVALLLSGLSFAIFLINLKKPQLLSPLIANSRLKFADNIWFPKSGVKAVSTSAIQDLTATAAFFVDTTTGDVLFDKNSRQKLPIASLTKIMTAVVALEQSDFPNQFLVSQKAANMEPDKMFLQAGEKLTLEELLNGVFLVSGNDAAEVIAEGTIGSREDFIKLMNSKAKQLGMKDSYFINPTGLEEDEGTKHTIATAYDIAILSRYAVKKWPKLVDITRQPHIYIPKSETHRDYDLYTGINLLTTMDGVVGFKTGYTPEAGLTLVTLARRGRKEVLGVLLGSTDRRDDARMLLEYSFKKLGI